MKKLAVFVFIFNLLVLTAFGQTCICPGNVSVSVSERIIKVGENAIFTANVLGDKDNRSTYSWTVSNGLIISGQGTKSITVQTIAELAGQNITATVEIGGKWCPVCSNMSASEMATVEDLPKPQLVDKFIRGNCEDVLSRMDYFLNELNNNPMDRAYFIAYGKPKIVAIAEREARNWVKIKGFDPSRITIIRGSSDSEKAEVELWRVPPGADPPEVKSLSETVVQENEKVALNRTEPYIFSSEYYDGIAGCGSDDGSGLDLKGFAEMLKENPKSRGNIVIIELTKNEFLKKEKEILQFLTKQKIARKRLKTFHQKAFGGVELWFLP